MNEAMRIGEDSIQRGEAGGTGVLDYARGCTWGYGLGGQAGHRGFETGPRQPAVLAGPVQVPRETGVRIQVSIADNLKVTAVGIQHAGQHFGYLGPFPGRPQTVGQQSNYASGGRVEPARGDQFGRSYAGDGEEQHDQRGDGGRQNTEIRRSQPSRHKSECGDERNLDADGRAENVEQGGGECQAYESAGQAQDTAAECAGEIGL